MTLGWGWSVDGRFRSARHSITTCEAPLTNEDSQQLPSDDGCTSDITLLRLKGISYAGGSEEHQCDNTGNLRCQSSMLSVLVLAEGSEASKDDEEDSVCVPKG
jgi:hypothetical protein